MSDRVDAATLDQARYILEIRGFSDIEFFTPENAEDFRRASLSGTGFTEEELAEWSARDEIESQQRRRGPVGSFLWALKQHAVFIVPLLVWNFFSWRGGRPFGWGDWLGFGFSTVYVIFFLLVVAPMIAFGQMLQAAVWHDWDAQRRWIRFIRLLRVLVRVGIPESELIYREANAIAAGGNLAGALAHVEPLRANPDIPAYMFLSRVSSIHEYAGDFNGQLKCVEEAVAAKPDSVELWIDVAAVRVRRFRNAAGAREALEKLGDKELPQIARAVLLLTSGIVSVEENDHPAAVTQLVEAEKLLTGFGNELIQNFIAELQAYLALALVPLGKAGDARKRFESVKALLVAKGNDVLISRVEAALGSAPA